MFLSIVVHVIPCIAFLRRSTLLLLLPCEYVVLGCITFALLP